jgi:hypothetical protein
MEATREQEKPQITLGNQVPNSFEELNTMTGNQFSNVENKVPNSFEELNAMTGTRYSNVETEPTKVQDKPQFSLGTKASDSSSISKNRYSNLEKNSADATLRFARSMNLPKFTATVKKPETEKEKYEIPESEYIWNPPYLKKTQIFPSYVRIDILN